MLTIRAILSRRGRSLLLFITATLVVAGCFLAVGYARLSGISTGVASAVLLLGVVALSSQATSSVSRRRGEIGLAQLRGRTGVRLLWSAIAEPVLVLVVATVAGTAIGWAVTKVVARRWVPSAGPFSPTSTEWAAVGVVLAAGVVVVVVASWRTTYEPLLEKLVGQNRPKPARGGLLFLQLCVLVGAAVTIYQARQNGPRHVDWVSLLSPALLGLACGQVAVWLARLIAAAVTRSSVGRGLGWFLTVRRLTRRADSVAVLRVMIAAAVLAAVAANAWVAADSWRQDTARLQVGAPVSYPVPSGALSAYEASLRADPDGRWLMSAVAFPDPTGGSFRRAFVDVSRWQRVVGDFFAGTPAKSIGSRLEDFPAASKVRTLRGTSFTMVATKQRDYHHLGRLFNAYVGIALLYVDDKGQLSSVDVPPFAHANPKPAGPGLVRWSIPIHDCHLGCLPTELDFTGAAPKRAPVRITELRFLGQDLLGSGPGGMQIRPEIALHASKGSGGVDIWTSGFFYPYGGYGALRLGDWNRTTGPAATITTDKERLDGSSRNPKVYGIDGSERAVKVVGTVPVLPFVGSAGSLLDLRTAVANQGATAAGAHAVVLARSDTPPAVIHRLVSTGAVGKPTTYQAAAVKSAQRAGAQGVRLYLLIALFALLLAIVTAVAGAADQLGGRRQEAASLRSVGLPARSIAGGYLREGLVLGFAVAVASLAAAWFACRALLGVLPLVDPGRFGLALDTAPRFSLLVPVAVGAGVVVTAVVVVAFRRVGHTSRPALLREDSR